MLAMGGSAIVVREMGAGEPIRASRDFTLIIGAGALLGVAITVLGIAFIDGIIWSLAQAGFYSHIAGNTCKTGIITRSCGFSSTFLIDGGAAQVSVNKKSLGSAS